MPKTVTNTIGGILNEEKWTRTSLNDYTIGNFRELDDFIETFIASGEQEEVAKVCEEHLQVSKDSIAALYLSGVISLRRHQVDDSHLLNLIGIFSEHGKWVAVEFLCKRILDFGENKDALCTLAETLEHLDRTDEVYALWERIIKIDYSETDMVRGLAEKKEADGDLEEALAYYRKAIHRFVNKRSYSSVREIWGKLLEHEMDDYEFFFLIEKKVARSMDNESAIKLMEDLYPFIQKREEWEMAIEVLKKILNYDGRNNWARQEIIACYKSHYASHSHVDDYIRLSNLSQGWRNVIEAIADFEKHISFDSGNFVFHKTWGTGIIRGIKGDEITIDFAKKRNHTMSLKMAIGALQSLTKDHIWVLKSIHARDKLKVKVKKDIPWALKIIIRSFDNVANLKKIKSELVPVILTPSEWTSWSSEAKRILKTDPIFGNVPDKIDQFIVRDRPMSFEEKTFNHFKAEKKFFGKIQTVREFLEHSEPDSEFFAEMVNYFKAFLNTAHVSTQMVASYLFIHKLSSIYPFLNPGLDWGFKELWGDIEDPIEVFSQLDDAELREMFLRLVRTEIEEWASIYLYLFPIQLSKAMLGDLVDAGYKEEIRSTIESMIVHYREYREGLIWVARHYAEDSFLKIFELNGEKILINMIRLLDFTFKEIENKREVAYNRKLNRQLQNYLFKEAHLNSYLEDGNKKTAVRVLTILDDIDDVSPIIKRDLRSMVTEKFPDIKLYGAKTGSESIASSSSRYFYTVQSSLNARKKELNHIIEVEIPKNSKEIGAAIELGDLSENAEYKAGKEKQENLQIQAGKLQGDIERARVFNEEDRPESGRIGFATVITLEDLIANKDEEYTILGPWESDPAKRILSYLSPFGSAFIGQRVDEVLEFDINDRHYHFKIKAVNPATIQ